MNFPLALNLLHHHHRSLSSASSIGGLYGWSSLAHDLNVDPSTAKCPVHEMKNGLSGFVSSICGVGVWSRVRDWFLSSPKSDRHPYDLTYSHDNDRYDILKIIQIIVSIVGLGISVRLLFYLIDQINPTMKEKRIARQRANQVFKSLGFSKPPDLNDYEVCIAIHLVDPNIISTSWNSIGGLNPVISEIVESVVRPLLQHKQTKSLSKLLHPPKGILMFGPPGCGKTMLARAVAGSAKANFINLQISTLVSMWYGETQKYVEATFSLAHKLQPSIIFIDEIDSFLNARSHSDNEATRMIKTQFMAFWDGLLTEQDIQVLVIGATNRPQDLDQAILRRLPYKVHVPLPNLSQRIEILQVHLLNDPLGMNLTDEDLKAIAIEMASLSGSDIVEICREAAFNLVNGDTTGLLKPEHFFHSLQKFNEHKHAWNIGYKMLPLD